ncbi:MAG TPA: O-antigen polysaccharide polymerase Wzy [Actinomycetota bacterium]|nr:O-antigen polysaccharide polymerase Wzy [Actinomycetota bacterium]
MTGAAWGRGGNGGRPVGDDGARGWTGPVPMAMGAPPREYARVVLLVPATLVTAWLALLVLRHEPLPVDDLGAAATITALFCVGATATALALHRLHLLSFPALFAGVTLLFTCSPLLLYRLEGYDAFSIWEFVDLTSVLVAMPVIMLGFSAFLLGALLVPTRGPVALARSWRPPSPADLARRRVLRQVGFVIYAVCAGLILASTLTGQGLAFAFEGGYSAYHGAKRAGDISRLVGVSVAHLLPWSLLILTATSVSRRERRQAVLLTAPFVLVMLAVGDRGGPIATMAVVASGLYLVGSRVGWGRVLGIGLVIAFLIPTILNLRQVPISDWSTDTIVNAATNRVEGTNTFRDDPITGFLVSMSSPYQTLMATVGVVPAQEPYHMGRDYLGSLVVAIPFRSVILPFLGAEIDRLPPSQWVLQILHPGRKAGPGYLQLAEAYLQFGAAGVVALYLLFGWSLTRLWRSALARVSDPRLLSFLLIVMMETLLWVRNSSTLIVRAVAWGWVLVYVLPAFLPRAEGSAEPLPGRRAVALTR